jgi:hypothetical protein
MLLVFIQSFSDFIGLFVIMGAQMEVPTEITLKGYKVKMYQ